MQQVAILVQTHTPQLDLDCLYLMATATRVELHAVPERFFLQCNIYRQSICTNSTWRITLSTKNGEKTVTDSYILHKMLLVVFFHHTHVAIAIELAFFAPK